MPRRMSASPRQRTNKQELSVCPLCARLCCKSPKLPGDKFPATRRTNRRPAIFVASITLPRSPVSSSSGDEVPHIFTRKARARPGEFLIINAKRLLQHYLPKSGLMHRSKEHLHSITSSDAEE